ncbi:hypothetical protein HJG60_009039 [Phyllostomus discolor]|uniref:Uncharacterized protein n=1 Tax=Phyllostomus discolor TaxID=89673 RepID=A0A834DH51_9CHIR|nr:hypothetical protein HJG60_009039 [Phyllostomus discolor]
MGDWGSVGTQLLGTSSGSWRGTGQMLGQFCGCSGVSGWGSLLPLLRIHLLHVRNSHFHGLAGDLGVQAAGPSSLRPRRPGPQPLPPPTLGSWSLTPFFPRTQESWRQHSDHGGVRCPALLGLGATDPTDVPGGEEGLALGRPWCWGRGPHPASIRTPARPLPSSRGMPPP